LGTEIFHYAILQKLLLTFVMTLAYGIYKQYQNKPIGFGTYSYVAAGSCALSYTALSIGGNNPLTLLGAIITGIGFLGAGALIKTGNRVSGFSSAAGIWLTAILGVNIGLGEYTVGFVLYGFIWGIVVIDWYLAKEHIGMYQRMVVLKTTEPLNFELIKELFQVEKIKPIMRSYNAKEGVYQIEFIAKLKDTNISRASNILKEHKTIVEFAAYEQ